MDASLCRLSQLKYNIIDLTSVDLGSRIRHYIMLYNASEAPRAISDSLYYEFSDKINGNPLMSCPCLVVIMMI